MREHRRNGEKSHSFQCVFLSCSHRATIAQCLDSLPSPISPPPGWKCAYGACAAPGAANLSLAKSRRSSHRCHWQKPLPVSGAADAERPLPSFWSPPRPRQRRATKFCSIRIMARNRPLRNSSTRCGLSGRRSGDFPPYPFRVTMSGLRGSLSSPRGSRSTDGGAVVAASATDRPKFSSLFNRKILLPVMNSGFSPSAACVNRLRRRCTSRQRTGYLENGAPISGRKLAKVIHQLALLRIKQGLAVSFARRIVHFAGQISRRGTEFSRDLEDAPRSPIITPNQRIHGALTDAHTTGQLGLRYPDRSKPLLNSCADRHADTI